MKLKLEDYRNAYDNWYFKSCKASNEKPVSFSTYVERIPASQVEEILKWI